jgi:hypothetical protein
MIALAPRARRPKRQPPPPPGAWEQLSFVWPVTPAKPKRSPPRLTVLPPERPRTRADCLPGGWNAQRPCSYVGCRHHNYLEVTPAGDLKINHPELEPWEIAETCSLDVADRGEHTQPEVGGHLGLSPQRTEQLESGALDGLKSTAGHLREEVSEAPGLRDRVLDVFRAREDSGERYTTIEDIHAALGIEDRRRKLRVYGELRVLLKDELLDHDGGREGKRLYWLMGH